MSPEQQSAEQQERDEIIRDLQAGVPCPGQEIKGTCAYHPSLAKGIIYLIRHTQPAIQNGWQVLAIVAAQSPWVLAIIALVGAFVWFMLGCPTAQLLSSAAAGQ